jgi:predicted nucleotidyltransferase
MRPSSALATHRVEVLELAAARGASRVRVFGSTARGEDRDGSDVDLLVDLPAGTSLLTLVALQQDLCDTLGVPVDLLTERELDPLLASQIMAQARPL